MQKKAFKRSTFNPLTQKIKAPEHLSKIQDYEDGQRETNRRFHLPNLQKRKSWKDGDNSIASWENSAATSVSWSSEIEDIATLKLVQQWEAVDRTLYNEDDQVTQASILEECVQWRTQVPHLRIIGKNPFLCSKQINLNGGQTKNSIDPQNEKIFSNNVLSAKEQRNSLKYEKQRMVEDEIFDLLVAHVIPQLFPNQENNTDSLHEDLNEVLKIHPAPVYSNRSSAKSGKISRSEKSVLHENELTRNNFKTPKNHLISMQNDLTKTGVEEFQAKFENLVFTSKPRSKSGGMGKNTLSVKDSPYKSQSSRNKCGMVFNEKIVVSPVPYVLSTRESFSTLRTTPIKFMGQTLDISTLRGRNIAAFRNTATSSGTIKISTNQSAWYSPVCPTVWPKNIRLAPINTPRLPSSKNRSLASTPTGIQRNRKPLSPISRSTLPSAHNASNNNNRVLEIQGKQVDLGMNTRPSLRSPGWDYTPRTTKMKKKKNRLKDEV